MTQLQLESVEVRENITKEEFQHEYVQNHKPVVLKNYSSKWPAKQKWNFNYFKAAYGHIEVPLYEEAFADSGKSYLDAQSKMKFKDYLDLIASQPTKKRMFLFNIFKHAPELCHDFDYPNLINGYLKKHPFMFFGGATSWVDAHMDLDNSHVFITQFQGEKKVILFDPKYSIPLYRHPLTVSTNVDIGNPDFKTYPLLKKVKGLECIINNGDTLFMPSGWWHYIYYTEGGFALSLRSQPQQLSRKIQGAVNIFKLICLDRMMTRLLGAPKWYGMKEKWAHKRAGKYV